MRRLESAHREDQSRLVAIDRSAGPYPWPETALQRALDREQVMTIRVEAEAVGFLVEQRILDETTLMHLAVESSHQGQGHARWALQHWLDDLARSGQARCLLEVRDSNQSAIVLYEALGFNEIGRRRGYYTTPGGTEDARVMARSLIDAEGA